MDKEVTACGLFNVVAYAYDNGLLRGETRPIARDAHDCGALDAVVTQEDLVHLVQSYGHKLTQLTIKGENTFVSFDPSEENPVGVLPVLKTLNVHTAVRHMVFESSNLPQLEQLDLNGCAALQSLQAPLQASQTRCHTHRT